MVNQAGELTREEPFSFFGAAVSSNQSTPQYGLLAGNKPMDGFCVTVAPSSSVILLDQDNQLSTFPSAMFTVGTVLFWSPAAFNTVGGGTFVPLYK
jgi:hypothetical protein